MMRRPPASPANPRPTVIDKVSIVDPRLGTATEKQTIVISGNRISYAGPFAVAPRSEGAHRIDGTGKYVIPGLWDTHIHTVALSPQPPSAGSN